MREYERARGAGLWAEKHASEYESVDDAWSAWASHQKRWGAFGMPWPATKQVVDAFVAGYEAGRINRS